LGCWNIKYKNIIINFDEQLFTISSLENLIFVLIYIALLNN